MRKSDHMVALILNARRWLPVLLLAGCAGVPSAPVPRQDTAPTLTPDTLDRLAVLPDPDVVEEPRSRYGNGPVYTVWGKSYRVMDTASGFHQEGLASWYGTKFHGRRTSSGEPYDIYKLTAAHRHLPLPTYVRVTNLANGKSTIVKVNDRGPFHSDRVIDLSYAAAVKLGFHRQGTSRVRIEVVEPAGQPDAFMVQAGAFSELDRADRSSAELEQLTGLRGVIVKIPTDGLYRVRLGPVAAGRELERIQALLLASRYGKPTLIPANSAPRNPNISR